MEKSIQDKFITIRVTPEFKDRLDDMSKRKHVSRSEYIKRIVEKQLATDER